MPKIDKEALTRYFTSGGTLYPLYAETTALYEELQVHAEGVFPENLLAKRRPSESAEILAYRRETYQPVTKLPLSKVISSFGKIRRSPDWCMDFPKDKIPASVIADETLERYCTTGLPGFLSVENWAFSILSKNNLIDANALVAVIPFEAITTERYARPIPLLFNSDHVIEFNEKDKWCILKSKRKVNYVDATGSYVTGDRFYYIDDKEIIIYDQDRQGYTPVFKQANLIKQMPVWKVKGDLLRQYDNMPLNQSRLHAMVPFLNKAAAGDSDLDGSKVQHLYPLFWYVSTKDCMSCNGVGKIQDEKTTGGFKPCTSCNGDGKVPFTPFAHMAISPTGLGEKNVPVPGAGFVERDVAILELQEKIVEKNNLKALSAVNMQFLDQTPLSISGDAKAVDREELNNTVYTVAEDLIYSIEKVVYFINEWRYSYLVPGKEDREAMLPNIPVPQNFDLLPADYLMKEVTEALTAKVNPLLVAELQKQLAAKKFYGNPQLVANINLYFELDPLPGMSADDKLSALSNKGITPEDYVISNYMPQFIQRALLEDSNFASVDYAKKMEVLRGYAAEKTEAIDAAAKIVADQKKKIMEELKGGGPVPPTGR